MSKRSSILQSSKVKKKKQKRKIIITLLSFFCLIILLVLFILILKSPYLQISTIEIKGANTLNIEEIKQKTFASIDILSADGFYLYFIPKSNILFYPKSLIKENLLDSYKKIDSIKIKRNGLSSIEISIKEKVAVAFVCEGFHEELIASKNSESKDENCFSVDDQAFVFEKASFLSLSLKSPNDNSLNDKLIRYYIISDLGNNIIGTNFIKKEEFDNLQKFVEIANKAQIKPIGILVGSQGDYEMYLKNIDNSETTVYFDDRAPFEKIVSNLVAFLENSRVKNKNFATIPIFDSINLRFGNNIFYVTK